MTRLVLFACVALAALPAAATASVDPSLDLRPAHVARGHTLEILGRSWVVGAGCATHVAVTVRRGSTRIAIGRPRVPPHTAFFRLHWAVPRDLDPGRWRVVATQRCSRDAPFVRRAGLTVS